MISPGDFLSVAKELYSPDNDDEGKFRTSISRAYYSSFHIVKLTVVNTTVFERGDSTFENHQQFIIKLQRDPDLSNFKDVGKNLHKLKKLRFKADYDIHLDTTRTDVVSSLKIAERIFSICDGM